MKKQLLALAVCAGCINMADAESKAQTGIIFGAQAGYSEGTNPPSNITISGIDFTSSTDSGNFNFGGFVGYFFGVDAENKSLEDMEIKDDESDIINKSK